MSLSTSFELYHDGLVHKESGIWYLKKPTIFLLIGNKLSHTMLYWIHIAMDCSWTCTKYLHANLY